MLPSQTHKGIRAATMSCKKSCWNCSFPFNEILLVNSSLSLNPDQQHVAHWGFPAGNLSAERQRFQDSVEKTVPLLAGRMRSGPSSFLEGKNAIHHVRVLEK